METPLKDFASGNSAVASGHACVIKRDEANWRNNQEASVSFSRGLDVPSYVKTCARNGSESFCKLQKLTLLGAPLPLGH